MIKATLYLNQDAKYVGFNIKGHAGYAESGKDIICAAVSTLAITIANSIETNTEAVFDENMDDSGSINFKITSNLDEKAHLLLSTLALGLDDLSKTYGKKYLKVHYKEV